MALKIGRPRAYDDEKVFRNKVENYFNTITIDEKIVDPETQQPIRNNNGEEIVETRYIKTPGIMALCNYLEITSETLGQYEKQAMFSETIKRARQLILERKLELLNEVKNPRGVMFDLSANYGMVEKKEVVRENHNYNEDLTTEERKERLAALMAKRDK